MTYLDKNGYKKIPKKDIIKQIKLQERRGNLTYMVLRINQRNERKVVKMLDKPERHLPFFRNLGIMKGDVPS